MSTSRRAAPLTIRGSSSAFFYLLPAILFAACGLDPDPEPRSFDQPREPTMTLDQLVVPEEPRQLEISGGQVHRFTFELEAEQFVTAQVQQKGIDVHLRLVGTKGHVVEMDAPSGSWGREEISWVSRQAGPHQLEIIAPFPEVAPGAYELVSTTPRPATDEDREHSEAIHQLCLGDQIRRDGRSEEALAHYHRAEEIWTRLGKVRWQLEARERIGTTQNRLGDLPGARATYLAAKRLAGSADLLEQELLFTNLLTALYLHRSQPDEAEPFLSQSTRLAKSTDHEGLRGAVDTNRALHHSLLGETDQALEILIDLTKRWNQPGRHLEQADALHNLANILTRKGRFVEAADAYARAAAAHRLGGNPGGWARAVVALADARYRAGEPAATARALEELFEEDARELVGPIWTALAHNSMGLAQARLGKTEEALNELEMTASIADEIVDRRLEALARFNRGAIFLRDDRPADALREFRAALETYESRSDSPRQAMAKLGIGQSLKSLGRVGEAIPHLEAALEIVESQRLDHNSWFFRMWFLASKQKYFEELIDTYMQLHELGEPTEENLSFAERALRVAERRRARTFLDAISEQTLRSSAPHELVEREQRALKQLQEIEAYLREARADEKLEWSARRRAAMVELEAARGQMREASPVYADLTRPEPLGSDAILSSLLDPQTRLLVYSLGEKKSYLWSLSRKGGMQAFALPGRAWIESTAGDALELVRTVSSEKQDERQAALARLADLILGDLYDSMESERLAIVPDGALELLPFSALRIPARPPAPGDADGRSYLVRHHEVTLLPSASSLTASRRGAARRSLASWEYTFVVDPVFSTFDDRALHLSSGELPEPTPSTETLTRTAQSLGMGTFLERLPGTALEAEIITENIPPDLVYLADGFNARKSPELERFLQHSRVLHFATHGLVDREHPESSALALTQLDEEGTRLDDGYLYAHEIFSLRIAAELVVLSACETGVGREVPGEGIQGLARAFLYAGAPRVVMSLWQVDDIRTARLMGELYRQMIREGLQPAEALRNAQLHLLENADPGDDAPFYWAGFQHLGDWRGPSAAADILDDSIAQEVTGGGVAPPDGAHGEYPIPLPPDFDPDRYSNGIDLATGAEIPYEELSAESKPQDDLSFLGPASPLEMQWWIENHAVDDPNRQTIYKVDPEKLDEAGWAVAFTPGTPLEVKEALAPLLELRMEQARERFRRIEIEPGWTSEDFRNAFEIGFGPADPEVLPYYVLLVGDPREISFELQYGLDIQYAVGRLHFDQVEDYNSYALAVKRAERNPPPPREAAIFGVDSGSKSDVFLRQALVDPLTRTLQEWRAQADSPVAVPVVRSGGDRKVDFLHLLQNPPGFLFAAGHGLDCSRTRDGMLLVPKLQGALVCSDRDAEGFVDSASYFCGDDLPPATDLQGMITFLFACYGAGTPEHDDFAGPSLGQSPRKIAPYPLVSHLAKRMLGHGAQAFVGHIDRAWSTSFSWHQNHGDQVKIFDSTCRQLLDGHRLGHAMEWFNQRFAEGSAELNQLLMVRSAFGPERASLLERMRKATFDARNYVVIGDPAVRLPGFGKL